MPVSFQMVHASWWYYFSKFTEFFDTVSLNYSKFKVLKLENLQLVSLLQDARVCLKMYGTSRETNLENFIRADLKKRSCSFIVKLASLGL